MTHFPNTLIHFQNARWASASIASFHCCSHRAMPLSDRQREPGRSTMQMRLSAGFINRHGRHLLRSAAASIVVAGVTIGLVLGMTDGHAISAQDKYTVQVPEGLAFAEFRGFEDWHDRRGQPGRQQDRGDPRQSRDDRSLPRRRARQRQAVPRWRQDGKDPLDGDPDEGSAGPDHGAGRAARHRLHGARQQAISRTPARGDTRSSTTTPISETFKPLGTGSACGYACHTRVKAKDYVFTSYGQR